jgi:hypothetical protein
VSAILELRPRLELVFDCAENRKIRKTTSRLPSASAKIVIGFAGSAGFACATGGFASLAGWPLMASVVQQHDKDDQRDWYSE